MAKTCFELSGPARRRQQPQPGIDQRAVDQKQLEAHLVSAQNNCRISAQKETDDRCGQADHRHPGVPADDAARGQAEEEKAEQRAVGVAGEGENAADDAGIVDGAEQHDHAEHDRRKADVDEAAPARRHVFASAEDVDAEDGGEGGEGGVGARIGGRGDAQQERHGRKRAETLRGKLRKQIVGERRQGHLTDLGIAIEQHAEREKQDVDQQEYDAENHYVLLGFGTVAACQILLHDVLIQTVHHNHDAHAGRKLLEEIVSALPVEFEHGAQDALAHDVAQAGRRRVEAARDGDHGGQDGGDDENGLQRVGPDHGLDSGPEGVEPYHGYRHGYGDGKRHAKRVEHKRLQDAHHQIEPERSADRLRDDERPRAGLARDGAEAGTQIFVDADKPHPVINRYQDKRYDPVAHKVAKNKLQIVPLRRADLARNRDERHARNGGAHHAERHERPRRTAVAREESRFAGMARG